MQTILSWIGSKANIFEKQMVREIASLIRDTDRHGKARIVDINEGEETPEMLKVTTVTAPSHSRRRRRENGFLSFPLFGQRSATFCAAAATI